MPRYTKDQLTSFVADRRYWDKKHPEHQAHLDFTVKAFEETYPDPLVPTPEQEEWAAAEAKRLREMAKLRPFWDKRDPGHAQAYAGVTRGFDKINAVLYGTQDPGDAAPASAPVERPMRATRDPLDPGMPSPTSFAQAASATQSAQAGQAPQAQQAPAAAPQRPAATPFDLHWPTESTPTQPPAPPTTPAPHLVSPIMRDVSGRIRFRRPLPASSPQSTQEDVDEEIRRQLEEDFDRAGPAHPLIQLFRRVTGQLPKKPPRKEPTAGGLRG